MARSKRTRFALALSALTLAGCGGHTSLTPATSPNDGATVGSQAARASGSLTSLTSPIQHIVLIIQENRSFDNLFQGYPKANTAASGKNSKGQTIQLTSIPLEAKYDIDHSFTAWNAAYDNGKLDGWDLEHAFGPGVGNYPNPQYGYVPQSEIGPYWSMAQQYVLNDEMFASDIDGSFVAHQYLIAGQANSEVNYPAGAWGCSGGSGDTIHQLTQQRQITQTTVPVCEDYQTLGDELDTAGLSWHTYSPTHALPSWNGYGAIKHIFNGPDWSTDMSGQTQILTDIPAGKLAAVTWVIPSLKDSDHASSDSKSGPGWVTSVVNAVGESQFWNTSVIFVLWDDWGGWFDHVPPKQLDYDGLGFRVPMLCISPYALKGIVSHKQLEFGSVLRYIENNFTLPQLAASDTRATPANVGCLNYKQKARAFVPISADTSAAHYRNEAPTSSVPDNE